MTVRQLLTTVSRVEGVVDVENVSMRRRHARGEMVDERATKTCGVPSRRRVFEARDGRLRGKGRGRLGAAADSHLQRRIVAQLVVIDRVLPAAADGEDPRADDLAERVPNARRITLVRQRGCEPRDNADFLLGRAQQQQPRVRRLVAAVEINCELLAPDGWKIEGKRC